ncbi:efflux RND transporter periplasmic adaptor subunit [Alkalitalea saponilacus]|uniref:RND family efflux transporter, MFP subunit n=2 Tax=Alkalitalea saponilacus TaxID=889453 RepID=A0A1T5EGH7_9BACT|nr:efflux RND transporter periplasmic adaptor subunit [Alkalitalea saponilacus]ASB48993.1 efflux RND transporter periplasmic adaptor subunit [Alkalitalea saponilacus]SKB82979.1 RND family efflux transporter, MFP subunit [Alkalitalea saponilacus]
MMIYRETMAKNIIRIVVVSIILVLHGCGARVADEEQDKRNQLAEYRAQVDELRQKIAQLEYELDNNSDRSRVNVGLNELSETVFEHFIEVMGRVQSDRNLIVRPEAAGNIVDILVKEGDYVRKGDIMARLNTDALDRSIQEMEVNLDLANTMYERQAKLWNQNIGSEVQYLQAKSNKESLERRLEGLQAQRAMAVVTSPVNGVVDEVIQKQGEMAGPSVPFARVVNVEQLYVTADVAERHLTSVRSGDSVSVRFPVLGTTRTETINRTSSVIDPDSRTFRIRVEMDNPGNRIKPNLMAVLQLRTYRNSEALVVPSILIKQDFTGQFLFIAEEENGNYVSRKRYITTGLNHNNNTVVESGLYPGDKVITEGFALVVDGTLLNVNN